MFVNVDAVDTAIDLSMVSNDEGLLCKYRNKHYWFVWVIAVRCLSAVRHGDEEATSPLLMSTRQRKRYSEAKPVQPTEESIISWIVAEEWNFEANKPIYEVIRENPRTGVTRHSRVFEDSFHTAAERELLAEFKREHRFHVGDMVDAFLSESEGGEEGSPWWQDAKITKVHDRCVSVKKISSSYISPETYVMCAGDRRLKLRDAYVSQPPQNKQQKKATNKARTRRKLLF